MASRILAERRGIHPLTSEAALLPDYRLVFTEPGLPFIEPAFASIEEAPGQRVHGVLHHLGDGGIEELDRFEGITYVRFEVEVAAEGSGTVTAWAYRARRPVKGRRPSRRYLALLMEGAREHGLPQEHVDRLRREPSVHIPILSRLVPAALHGLELAIARSDRVKRLAHRLYALSEPDGPEDPDSS